jgi:hypothetical protein
MRYKEGSTFVNSTGFQRIQSATPAIFPRDFAEISSVSFAPPSKAGPCEPEPCATWWTITATAREVVRQGTGAPSSLLQWSDINAQGNPGTDAQILVRWEADVALVDIGAGARFSILAPAVTVSLRVPAQDARVITNQNVQGGVGLTGAPAQFVKDTLVTVGASCAEAPIGDTIARLTRTYDLTQTDVLAPNGAGAIAALPALYRVPSRARRVTFSVPDAVAVPGAGVGVRWYQGQPDGAGVGVRLGLVDDWGRRTSPAVEAPGSAGTFLLVGFAAGATVTATWELDL